MASFLVRRGFVSAYRLTEKTLSSCNSTKMSRILEASSRFSGSRSYIPTPSYVSFNQQWLKTQLLLMPKTRSLALTKIEGKHIVIQDYARVQVKGDDDLHVLVTMDEVEDADARIDGNHLLVQGNTTDGVTTYLAAMNLPLVCDKKRGLKWLMMRDGTLIATLHSIKYKVLWLTNLLSDLLHTSRQFLKLQDDYVVFSDALFDRTYLQHNIFPLIACPDATCRSFTNYKNTHTSLYLKMSSGESEQMDSTSESLCASLEMPGFKIEDVTFSFENNNTALVIEGKTDTEHYLAGFHIPEGYETKIGNIKTEMHQGVYKATLPCKHAN